MRHHGRVSRIPAVTPATDSPSTRLVDAVAAADLRVLVLCLYHLTGDDIWLSERYAPARDVRLVADPDAGFDDQTQAEIRAAAVDILTAGGGNGTVPEPVVTDPDPERFQEMMSFCLGEPVPNEYVPLMLDDFGFTSEDARWTNDVPPDPPKRSDVDHEVLIVGAGVSGMCLGIKLDRLGIPYTIVEKNPEVGGTWFENRYPGCGVDTPNHFYSYSFAPNPTWRHYFSPRDELFDYLRDCASDFDLRPRIRFSTTMTSARWEDDRSRWRVTLVDGGGHTSQTTARILVSATGHFNQPMAARFPGDEAFEGPIVHTARWPDNLDLTDADVAVIGTGASSVQLVPTIAPTARHVTVYQRTPQWVRPTENYNGVVDPRSRWLFANLPYYGRWYRFAQFWRYGDGLLRFLRRDPEWPHPERAMNGVNDRHRIEMTEHIVESLASRPELIDDCIPSYPPFGKRILLDNDWYTTLCRPNVDLVTESIDHFEINGIRTSDGRLRAADVIVLATGFTVTTLAARHDIVGRDDIDLADDWADDNPTAYLGLTVPRFPNFFVMYGPNTNLGHGGSGMWVGETQARYIAHCLTMMGERGWTRLEVRPERRRDYTAEIDTAHAELIWAHPGTNTYYRNANGQVRSPMPFRMVDYWHRTRRPDPEDFVFG